MKMWNWRYAVLCALAFGAWKFLFAVINYQPASAAAAPSPTTQVAAFDPSTARLAADPSAGPGYAGCILDRMPGSSNPEVTAAQLRSCLGQFPDGLKTVSRGVKGAGRFSTPDECITAKAAETKDPRGASLIAVACTCLYSQPSGTACAE